MSTNITAAQATSPPPPPPSSSCPPFDQIRNQTPQIPHPSEQLCYVHCTLCDTVLGVSVPCASLFKSVTVRCGHCSNLLPVNMRALPLIPPPPPLHDHQLHFPPNLLAATTTSDTITTIVTPTPSHANFSDEINSAASSLSLTQQINGINNFVTATMPNSGGTPNIELRAPRSVAPPIVNRPPEKRQRVPSAYNRFIKDEIQRIKAGNPDITHREAFSAAAKNWAHFPHIHFGLMPGHHAIRKTNMCPQVHAHPQSQDGDDIVTKDGFFASTNFGILPY